MLSTFINPIINPDAKLGISAFDDCAPVQLWPTASNSEIEVVIRAIYRQVLGNAHVMESERLRVLESQLQNGGISVRSFVRQLAQSDLYRSRFFENCSRLRSIELNFKHLLGRAPESYEEITEHTQCLDQEGFAAEIDTYIDSNEYLNAFGENTVPYYRGYKTQTGKNMVGFTHLLKLLRGGASSDQDPRQQNSSRLNASLMRNRPSPITSVVGFTSTDRHGIDQASGFKTVGADQFFIPAVTASRQPTAVDRQMQFYQAYQPFKETDPVERCPGDSVADVEAVLRAIYRQVLGNAYVMESERLTVAESQFQRGELSVREFVRALAKSALYRSRFFETCYRYRSIELNFKHLLGRAPDNFDEMRYHSAVLDQAGFEADIDSYIDSDEYQLAFGETLVPYYRGYQTQAGQSLLEFTNMFQLLRSASSSDKDLAGQNKPQLTRALVQNSPYGKLQIRDGSDILAEVFKSSYAVIPTATSAISAESYAITQALQQMIQTQAQTIAELKQRLANLQSLAGIGAAYLKNGWQPVSSPSPGIASDSSQQQASDQVAQIAALQAQIAETQSYATIGEARLNKWRNRSFNN